MELRDMLQIVFLLCRTGASQLIPQTNCWYYLSSLGIVQSKRKWTSTTTFQFVLTNESYPLLLHSAHWHPLTYAFKHLKFVSFIDIHQCILFLTTLVNLNQARVQCHTDLHRARTVSYYTGLFYQSLISHIKNFSYHRNFNFAELFVIIGQAIMLLVENIWPKYWK